jgi:hypothetical protein
VKTLAWRVVRARVGAADIEAEAVIEKVPGSAVYSDSEVDVLESTRPSSEFEMTHLPGYPV